MAVAASILTLILAGGEGSRLGVLTEKRAKPAVPFGAIYRIIDITLSNCVNSQLNRVYVLTQYKALSLNRHIRQGLAERGIRPGLSVILVGEDAA